MTDWFCLCGHSRNVHSYQDWNGKISCDDVTCIRIIESNVEPDKFFKIQACYDFKREDNLIYLERKAAEKGLI